MPDMGLTHAGMERPHAVVVGSGLAGAVSAWALCREGWQVTVLDQHEAPAQEASGNPGGLFHSIVHGQDGVHARAHRAAALQTAALVSNWLRMGQVTGQCEGLMRLDASTSTPDALALLNTLNLPVNHVTWLDQTQAQAWSGAHVPSGGWLFQQGGWVAPGELVKALLTQAQATGRLRWQGGAHVVSITQSNHRLWQAIDSDGHVLAQGQSLVLANANDCQRLMATLPDALAVASLPMGRVRGQISRLPPHAQPGPTALSRPVAGSGYALRLGDGSVLCGATSHHHDDNPQVREADHEHNLQQALRLGVWGPARGDDDSSRPEQATVPKGIEGRVGWRATTPDRLPLVGALPLPLAALQTPGDSAKPMRMDQPRLIPRRRDANGGLFILSGLGSRGITWSVLCGRLLAHWVTGSPCPIEADLRDAMDPARWIIRESTKGSKQGRA